MVLLNNKHTNVSGCTFIKYQLSHLIILVNDMHSSCIPNIRESEGRGRGGLFDVMNEWLLLPPLSQLIFFLRKASVKLSFMLLHRHRAIILYAFGVAWLNSRGLGLF